MGTARTAARRKVAVRARVPAGLRVILVDGLGRPVAASGLAAWLQRVAPRRAAGIMTVALASDRRVRVLNARHRGIDRSTDVLSFAAAGSGNGESAVRGRHSTGGDRWLGDVVIATGTARRQARAAGHSYGIELRVLALHGLLHLLGFDHVSDGGRMEQVERRLRRKGGLEEGLIEKKLMIPLGLFLLACAAIYVGVLQAAFSALMRLSLRLLAERTGRTAQLGRYLEEPLLLFVPARLLMGLIIGLAALLLARVTGVHGAGAILLLILSTGVFILAFEHVIPLLIVRHDPERALNLLLPSFTVAVRPIHPLLRGLSELIGVERVRGLPIQGAPEEPEENAAPSAGIDADTDDAATPARGDERQLLRSIVNFGDTLVREVMTPRPDIVAIRADASTRELKALFREQEYSRIPVYFENLDNIVGVVFVKDLIQHGEDKPIAQLMRPPYFVPETKPVSDLLKEFQRKRVQGAIVVDEYGGTAGLVTLEDLLEEIVGEIRDEYDDESEPVVDEGNGSFVFSGKVDIDDVADRLKIQIQREGFETVGGYLLSHLGRVPAVGETFEVDGLSVEVLDAERRRVNKVRIRRLAQPALESPAGQ